MRKAGKVLAILSCLFLGGAVASGSTLLIKHFQNDGSESEAVYISSPDFSIVNEMDLGIISLGEEKVQRFDVKSLVGLEVRCTLSIAMDDIPSAGDYLYVSMSCLEEKTEKRTFRNVAGEKSAFEFRIPSEKTRRVEITYSLMEDVPEDMLETRMSFSVLLNASTVI